MFIETYNQDGGSDSPRTFKEVRVFPPLLSTLLRLTHRLSGGKYQVTSNSKLALVSRNFRGAWSGVCTFYFVFFPSLSSSPFVQIKQKKSNVFPSFSPPPNPCAGSGLAPPTVPQGLGAALSGRGRQASWCQEPRARHQEGS